MNKAELAAKLASQIGVSKKTAHAAVDGAIDIITESVKDGDSVVLSGFGVFELRKRAARTARNPQTGQSLIISPTMVPFFRPGQAFKELVGGGVVVIPKTEDDSAPRSDKSAIKQERNHSQREKNSTAEKKKAEPLEKILNEDEAEKLLVHHGKKSQRHEAKLSSHHKKVTLSEKNVLPGAMVMGKSLGIASENVDNHQSHGKGVTVSMGDPIAIGLKSDKDDKEKKKKGKKKAK